MLRIPRRTSTTDRFEIGVHIGSNLAPAHCVEWFPIPKTLLPSTKLTRQNLLHPPRRSLLLSKNTSGESLAVTMRFLQAKVCISRTLQVQNPYYRGSKRRPPKNKYSKS